MYVQQRSPTNKAAGTCALRKDRHESGPQRPGSSWLLKQHQSIARHQKAIAANARWACFQPGKWGCHMSLHPAGTNCTVSSQSCFGTLHATPEQQNGLILSYSPYCPGRCHNSQPAGTLTAVHWHVSYWDVAQTWHGLSITKAGLTVAGQCISLI